MAGVILRTTMTRFASPSSPSSASRAATELRTFIEYVVRPGEDDGFDGIGLEKGSPNEPTEL